MFLAGTLGTALGDSVSDFVGVADASLLLAAVVIACFAARLSYWVLIVAIRTAGTSIGDWTADQATLTLSTVVTGACFVATLTLWSPREVRLRPQP
jgi:uncharacterized membrane-anchored protein